MLEQQSRPEPTFLGLFEKQKAIIIFIISVTAVFFWQVVIPIKQIQVQLVSIETKLADTRDTYTAIQAKQIQLESRLQKVETVLDQHIK